MTIFKYIFCFILYIVCVAIWLKEFFRMKVCFFFQDAIYMSEQRQTKLMNNVKYLLLQVTITFFYVAFH